VVATGIDVELVVEQDAPDDVARLSGELGRRLLEGFVAVNGMLR
jgi:hypothetical protein